MSQDNVKEKIQDLFERKHGKGVKMPAELTELIEKHERGEVSLDEIKEKIGKADHKFLDKIKDR